MATNSDRRERGKIFYNQVRFGTGKLFNALGLGIPERLGITEANYEGNSEFTKRIGDALDVYKGLNQQAAGILANQAIKSIGGKNLPITLDTPDSKQVETNYPEKKIVESVEGIGYSNDLTVPTNISGYKYPVQEPNIYGRSSTVIRANNGILVPSLIDEARKALSKLGFTQPGDVGHENRFERQNNFITGASSIFDVGVAGTSLNALNRMSGYKYRTTVRPQQIDPYKPETAYRSVIATEGQNSDRFFNSLLRHAKESGSPFLLADFMEQENKKTEARTSVMSNILNNAAQLNASIQERNAALNQEYWRNKDQENLYNNKRDETIRQAKVNTVYQTGKSIFQNYINNVSTNSLLNSPT